MAEGRWQLMTTLRSNLRRDRSSMPFIPRDRRLNGTTRAPEGNLPGTLDVRAS
jgi:hypothetical protein